jgi:Skp family chaperone for outer membrane proteins
MVSAAANVTSELAPERAEAQAELAPLTATARALTSATANKTARPKVKKPEDLQTIVSEQAAQNAQELEDALRRVPDSVKTAVERAITVADDGYDDVLENIGR